jgi:Fe2+ or Zn2+ uptake regulation protein
MDKRLKEEAKRLLKGGNLNRTAAQVRILEELLRAKSPLSGEEIVVRLGSQRPDKATVYRIMERLDAAGLVHKVYLNLRAWKYELARNCGEKQCHPHFTCSRCGQTYCLHGLFPPLVKGLEKGFVVHRQQIRIEGLCAACS